MRALHHSRINNNQVCTATFTLSCIIAGKAWPAQVPDPSQKLWEALTSTGVRCMLGKGQCPDKLSLECGDAVEDVSSLLVRGQAARKVGETALNRESSRSHSVFTCTLECSSTDASGVTQILHSRLNLVDLAGRN